MNDDGSLVVVGGRVLGVDGRLTKGDVVVRRGRIESVPDSDVANRDAADVTRHTLDATGKVVVPGFIDLQCNGAVGMDLTAEPERLWDIAAALPRWGVTAWLPTIVTSPDPIRQRARSILRSGPPADGWHGAVPLGLHFEGPFLALERRGAHAAEHLQTPHQRAIDGWSAADGVAVVTLAPELPGALDITRTLVDRGVVVSAGHSSATVAEATAAVDAGVSWVTHLFNAMAPLHHREPGLAAVALTDERLSVGVIADGLHLHPTAVDLVTRLLKDRLTLVTDAVAALGVAPGIVRLGDVEALADGEGVRIADGTLAGSVLAMDRAVANLMEFTGCDLADAVAAATTAPSRLLGQQGERGVIHPGARADMVVLEGTDVAATVIGGSVVYERQG